MDLRATPIVAVTPRGLRTSDREHELDALVFATGFDAMTGEAAHRTLYPRAASWYMGANIPGKPRVFMPYIGGVGAYRQICDEVAARGYDGFAFRRAADDPVKRPGRAQPRHETASA